MVTLGRDTQLECKLQIATRLTIELVWCGSKTERVDLWIL